MSVNSKYDPKPLPRTAQDARKEALGYDEMATMCRSQDKHGSAKEFAFTADLLRHFAATWFQPITIKIDPDDGYYITLERNSSGLWKGEILHHTDEPRQLDHAQALGCLLALFTPITVTPTS